MVSAIHLVAKLDLPAGYRMVTDGVVQVDDLLWNFLHGRWELVTPTKKCRGDRSRTRNR